MSEDMPERRHERDYTAKGFRRHMLEEHGVRVGSIRLATYFAHRKRHAMGWMKVPHTHRTEREG